MLKELYIENLAIIEKAVISFDENFNVFTGETGAGKSILIGGINAVIGSRTNKDIVRMGCDKGLVTALFTDLPDSVCRKLEDSGYGTALESDELIIMREISSDGKSTARVNGKTVSAAILREITVDLLDIHGQHDSRILMSADNHREMLDSFGGYGELLGEYRECFRGFSSVSKRLRELEKRLLEKSLKTEILQKKLEEIDCLNLSAGDDKRIAQLLIAARNVEETADALNLVFTALSGSDEAGGALDYVNSAVQGLGAVCGQDRRFTELFNRLELVYTELSDIKSDVVHLMPDDSVLADLPALEEKMSGILALKRKYKMELDDILNKRNLWADELAELEYSGDLLTELHSEKKELGEKLKSLGAQITAQRMQTAERLAENIRNELIYLDMPDVAAEFRITADKVTVNGMDNVEIYISANKGEPLKPIAKVASGGELSRIMLALKSCLAQADDIPTMIFDEIDSGISGRAANKVGIKLRKLSEKRQVLCVTHLAQIAAKATNHLLIEKNSGGERVFTEVRKLDSGGRKAELARIISGDAENESAVKAAEDLLLKLDYS